MKKTICFCMVVCLLFFNLNISAQSKTVKKVVLEGFWWNYKNNNFTNSWANYITELAPRLKQLGIDMVWIPPSSKGGGGVNDVGYGVFDNYDLGDKFQKNNVRTRMGTKDELLRMIAVLHANGIEVMQDIVGNQLNGAGDLSSGGLDPTAASANQWKNFRYTSYAHPATKQASAADSATEYLTRPGRFSKNWQNFHNNPAHNGCESTSGDAWCYEMFGPDICYYDGAMGQSNNAIFNPTQTGSANNGYMRAGMRNWITWFKKQTGFDGIRLDAAKNYEYSAAQDWLWNLQNNAGFATASDTMIAVGEFVGSSSEQDGWCNNVTNMAGTFDFNLRGSIYSMATSNGYFDMSTLPGAQQNNRVQYYSDNNAYVHRTVPFVNNHDTYRPITDALGNVTGWDGGNELMPHIDPIQNNWMPLAYASILSMDGNPQIFFEDLFNIYNSSKRLSHLPSSTTDLPVNAALQNLIQCHQKLQFKNGAYKVRSTSTGGNVYFNTGSSAVDLLVIERSNKALIGLNDRGDAVTGWQSAWVNSDFPSGTVLKDYSGANGTATFTVGSDQRVNVNTPPVDPANNLWGYSIWAPVGFDNIVYSPSGNTRTTQEWEMADDLGDSHCNALGYGGALPSFSTNQRVVGKIFSDAGKNVVAQVSVATNAANVLLSIWDLNGNKLTEANGASPINYTPATQGWLVIKVRNVDATVAGQNISVRLNYQAPQVVNTRDAALQQSNSVAIWTGNKNSTDITDCGNWEEALMPSATTNVLVPANASPMPVINTSLSVKNITIENGASLQINSGNTLSVYGDWINNNTSNLSVCGMVAFSGTATQQLYGQNSFCTLQINNPNGVNAQNNNWVNTQLVLQSGNFILNNYNLTLNPGCTISGGSASSFVNCTNAATGGFLYQQINSNSNLFPVGNSNYTPVSITNNGTVQNCRVRCFEYVLANGLSGASLTTTDKIKKTWEITPQATGAVTDMVFNWATANQDATFNSANCYVSKNLGGTGQNWQQISTPGPASGSGSFSKTATGISTFSKFTVLSNPEVLPINIINFSGVAGNNTATINFKIATTDLIKNFQILKSVDGTHFSSIGVVLPVSGNAYSFTDNSFTQNAFYKLQILEAAGTIIYSNVIFLKIAGQNKTLNIYPNLLAGRPMIFSTTGFTNTETIQAALLALDGTRIADVNGNIISVQQALNAQLPKISAGMYILKISSPDFSQMYKIVK